MSYEHAHEQPIAADAGQQWAIDARGLSKHYEIYDRPSLRLRQFIWPRLQRWLQRPVRQYYRKFQALQEIDIQVRKGQTVGIIGRNGSGKSTLLQIICGTLHPSAGQVQVQGRVAALLELGSGFNPEFTGRENVYFNASILGQDESVTRAKFADIEAFADIGDFIDQPVKTYSSGMLVRLAFAVIAHVDADILVIDEALAVGDAFFTQKCMRFLRNFMRTGTVLFVSHDLGAVKNLCTHAVWIDRGCVRYSGDARTACDLYLEELFGQAPEPLPQAVSPAPLSPLPQPEPEPERSATATAATVAATENFPALRPWQGPAMPVDVRAQLLDRSVLRNDIHVFDFDPDAPGFSSGKARITQVSLCNLQGQPLAFIVGGEVVALQIRAQAYESLESPIVGFYIKDRLGQNLFGDNTWLSYCDAPPTVPAGHELFARFVFTMPRLHVGEYSMTVALAQGSQEVFVQHHWIHDALQFASHTSSVAGGLLGLPMQEIALDIGPPFHTTHNPDEEPA